MGHLGAGLCIFGAYYELFGGVIINDMWIFPDVIRLGSWSRRRIVWCDTFWEMGIFGDGDLFPVC